MNLSLPFLDPDEPSPGCVPAAVRPQAGAGAGVGAGAAAATRPAAAPRWAFKAGPAVDASAGVAVAAAAALPLTAQPNLVGFTSPEFTTTTARDDAAGQAAIDPLAGAGFEGSPDAITRAAQLSALHPSLWRASQLGGAARRVTPSGFEALDAELPGGGWPHGALTELLLAQPGVGELRLLASALGAAAPVARRHQQQHQPQPQHQGRGRSAGSAPGVPAHVDESRCVMLFDPPAALSAWALAQCGLSSRHWLVVQARAGQQPGRATSGVAAALALAQQQQCAPGSLIAFSASASADAPAHDGVAAAARHIPRDVFRDAPHNTSHNTSHNAPRHAPRSANRLSPLLASADLLWALEQALKSGHVGTILAWLPLTLRADALRRLQIAAQSHDGPVFVFRDALARSKPSPAPLRCLLAPAGVDGLSLRVLKRRGPPLAQPLRLALPSTLSPRQQAQAQAREATERAMGQVGQPLAISSLL